MEKPQNNRLENFPVSFFSVVMGICGLTIAWEKAQHAYHTQLSITPVMVGIVSAVFILFAINLHFKNSITLLKR